MLMLAMQFAFSRVELLQILLIFSVFPDISGFPTGDFVKSHPPGSSGYLITVSK